jgi:tetratricopeptide (TPR) repeat protein
MGPKPRDLPPEEIERILIKNVEDNAVDPKKALWQLAQFYKRNRKHDQALSTLRNLLELVDNVEDKARCIFTMGQSSEGVGDFAGAIRYYKEALVMEPADTLTWYFILNNLGYSYNQLGQFEEGEKYCRLALKVPEQRSNALKNLGLALEGQGRYAEAGHCYVRATQVNALDGRSLWHLRNMIEKHPELGFDFDTDLRNCAKAVQTAWEALNKRRENPTNPFTDHGVNPNAQGGPS